MKKVVSNITWSLLAVATITLLVAAMYTKDNQLTANVTIQVAPATNGDFVQQREVQEVLGRNGARKGAPLNTVNLNNIELQLEKNPWIQQAEAYYDNRRNLHVLITTRVPIARVFTVSGNSFYIDSACIKMPLVDIHPERMLLFTSFPSDNKKLSVPDSLLMQDIKHIATFIEQDSFWMAQTAQIDITPEGKFVLIPVMGNQQIILGDAGNLPQKFQALKAFYMQAWKTLGLEKYAVLNLEYAGQLVATRRGAYNPHADTSKAIALFGNTDQKLKNMMKDTVYTAPVKPVDTLAKAKDLPGKKVTVPVKKATQKVNANPKNQNKKTPKAILKKPVNP